MQTRMIYLVRHGQYVSNEVKSIEGMPARRLASLHDGGLTALGTKQAEHVAERLSGYPISKVYCSSLPRAVQTAKIIVERFPHLSLQTRGLFRECTPFVENEDACNRALKAYGELFKYAVGEDKHEIVVCHGNLLRYFVSLALGLEPDGWATMGTFHCGITQMAIDRKGVRLISHNDFGHIPDAMRTKL